LTEALDIPASPQVDGFVEVGSNLKLSYRQWNNPDPTPAGNPPFLLIHGLASARRIWDLVAPELVTQGKVAVVALDQRGHGLSDKPDTGYSTDQVVADDLALATALNLAKPIVVGHSWGATIALAYAASHPEAVSGLVLVDGGMGNMKERLSWEEAEKNLAPPEFAGTPKDVFLDFYRKGRQAVYFEPVWNPQFEDIVLNIVQVREDDTVAPRLIRSNHMQILRSLWETDNLELAKQLKCPVLMVSAESTAVPGDERGAEWTRLKREGATQMQTALAGSTKVEFVAMADTIHDIPLQRPVALAKLMLRFFQEAGILS
jgi:pimeloyl-ACP methyl ester carboxylesterase